MYYIHIPSHVYLNQSLSKSTQTLYGLLIALAHKDGYCYATNKSLAEMLEISISTINKSLAQLKQHELISVEMNDLKNFRKIMTVDTVNGLRIAKKSNKAPKTTSSNYSRGRIVRDVPTWVDDFIDSLPD